MPGDQLRMNHSATVVHLSEHSSEVTLFGGCSKWVGPEKAQLFFVPSIAKTTVLEFGESWAGKSRKTIQ